MRRLTGRTGAIIGLFSAVVLLFTTINVGLRVPRETRLDPFGSSASLDYRALRFGSFEPLRSEFIARELGGIISNAGPRVLGATRARSAESASVAAPPPLVVSHTFTNDDLKDAYPVSSVPFTARTNTSRATKQPGEPTTCAPVGGTAWYRFSPPRAAGLIADTFGSEYATALGVFSGTGLNDLRRIGCDTDAGGLSQIAFAAKAGVTYWFQITGPFGGGDLVFNLRQRGITTVTSISSGGGQGDADALLPAISADGRYVSFYSGASNFAPDHPPPPPCVPTANFDACRPAAFVRDRRAHRVSRIDVTPAGAIVPAGLPVDQISITAGMSGNGRYVGFYSTHTGLVENDINETWDVFTYDQIENVIRRVSVSSSGDQGNMASFGASISGDGRFVAFTSAADNLVPGDTNVVPDVFVHDTKTGETIRVSVSSDEVQADQGRPFAFPLESGSHLLSMSKNGRYVVFRSAASNLVPGDTNNASDYFLRDVRTGTTERINVSSSEEQANSDSRQPLGTAQWIVSDDGRYVFFNSDASNLVPGDSNGVEDLFVRDRLRGTTRRVSVSSEGREANRGVGEQDPVTVYRNVGLNLFVTPVNVTQTSYSATPDGQFVAFSSAATNLVPGDVNDAADVFLRHVPTGRTTILSVSATGEQGNGASNAPVLSADAGFVAFQSAAENLVPSDSNGHEDIFTYEVPRQRFSGWY